MFKSLKEPTQSYYVLDLHQVGSIVELSIMRPEVGVATSNGRAYYRIASILKRSNLPYSDIILPEAAAYRGVFVDGYSPMERNFRIIITTRKERLQLPGNNVICVEELADDIGLAKEKLLPLLYPSRPSDFFVVGIDPGERTGIAAFINHREVESCVQQTMQGTIERTCALIDNAPSDIRKIVKIGAGNLSTALRIAEILRSRFGTSARIQLVNESGTSSLTRRGRFKGITRDQRAAKLIAFRDGEDYMAEESQQSAGFTT